MQESLVRKIQAVLSDDLLKQEYRGHPDNPTYGHCYAASEALYHLLGGYEFGLGIFRARDQRGVVHWWLQYGNSVIDPTAEQYTSVGLVPPYIKGKRCGFLTKEPSARAQTIMDRVNKL